LGAFGPSFYIRNFSMTATEVGIIYGLITVFGSMIGVICGGILGDKLRETYVNGKLYLIMASAVLTGVTAIGFIHSENLVASFTWKFVYHIASTAWLGCAASTVTELVLPRLRAVASAFFILMLSMIGLALGPYLTGMVSDIYINSGLLPGPALKNAMTLTLVVLVLPFGLLAVACKYLKNDEAEIYEKARSLGEEI